jgi:hypothetical protein
MVKADEGEAAEATTFLVVGRGMGTGRGDSQLLETLKGRWGSGGRLLLFLQMNMESNDLSR